MVVKRTPPRYPRQGPSCLFVLFIMVGISVSFFVITRAEDVRDVIIPTPTPQPTRSATEYALLADLSERDGELDEAVDYYRQSVQLDATNPEFYIRLINLLVQVGEAEEALSAGEQATVLAPNNDRVWTAVAAAYLANGDRLVSIGDRVGADLQYTEAVQAADRAIELNADNATAFAYKAAGLILPQDPSRYERAQEAADIAIQIDPNDPLARLYMGVVLDYQGYYNAAREQYQLGIDADPSLVDLHYSLAYNYFGTGNTSEAILKFQDAISVDPDYAPAYDGLAYMYLQLGEDVLAIDNAVIATELDPTMARARGRLGEAYFRQSNYDKAIEELEIAVDLYGQVSDLNARFFNLLATAYIRKSTTLCPQAVPLFEQVSETNSLARDAALEGLEECRLAGP